MTVEFANQIDNAIERAVAKRETAQIGLCKDGEEVALIIILPRIRAEKTINEEERPN